MITSGNAYPSTPPRTGPYSVPGRNHSPCSCPLQNFDTPGYRLAPARLQYCTTDLWVVAFWYVATMRRPQRLTRRSAGRGGGGASGLPGASSLAPFNVQLDNRLPVDPPYFCLLGSGLRQPCWKVLVDSGLEDLSRCGGGSGGCCCHHSFHRAVWGEPRAGVVVLPFLVPFILVGRGLEDLPG